MSSADKWDVSFENHDPCFKPEWTKLSKDELIDKIKGVIFGQAIGDAIGLATEFMNKREAIAYYGKDGPKGYDLIVQDFHRSRWRKGDWTDDTDQMILILASLLSSKGRPLLHDLAKRLVMWMKHGFKELGDAGGMGIGMTTHRTLSQPSFISEPHETARDVWEASGRYLAPNGAVMRTSILGVVNFGDMGKVIYQTREMCHVTHADPRCLASCVTVTAAIALMLQGKYDMSKKKEVDKLINESCQIAQEVALSEDGEDGLKEFHRHVKVEKLHDLKLDDAKTIGYTYKALGAGVHGLRYGKDFKKIIMELIMEAGDADSNASVCGALLGCKLGYNRLPPDLLNGLVYKKWLDGLVERLLTMMGILGEPTEDISAEPASTLPVQAEGSPPTQHVDADTAEGSPPTQHVDADTAEGHADVVDAHTGSEVKDLEDQPAPKVAADTAEVGREVTEQESEGSHTADGTAHTDMDQ